MRNLLYKYKNYTTLFILLFLLIALKTANPSFVKAISFLSFDLYQKIFPLKKESSEVVIIDIDEKSLKKFGQFPWNRSVFARIIENVNIAEPKALIGFTGPRVIEQTIRQKLPKGFQRAEFLLEHGMIDAVVLRPQMKNFVANALNFFCGPAA